MVTPQFETAEADVRLVNTLEGISTIDGRGGDGGVFGYAGNDRPHDQYEAWVRQLDASGKTPMREILEFITLARPRDQAQAQRIDMFATLGMWQLTAPVNNSTRLLALLNTERAYLEAGIRHFCASQTPWHPPQPTEEDDPDTWATKASLFSIGSKESAIDAAGRCAEIRQQVKQILAEIALSKREGTFRDHSMLMKLFQDPDPNRELNGEKHMRMPFFLQECFTEVMECAAGSYQPHIEALHARLMQYFGGGNQQEGSMAQRMLQANAPQNRPQPGQQMNQVSGF